MQEELSVSPAVKGLAVKSTSSLQLVKNGQATSQPLPPRPPSRSTKVVLAKLSQKQLPDLASVPDNNPLPQSNKNSEKILTSGKKPVSEVNDRVPPEPCLVLDDNQGQVDKERIPVHMAVHGPTGTSPIMAKNLSNPTLHLKTSPSRNTVEIESSTQGVSLALQPDRSEDDPPGVVRKDNVIQSSRPPSHNVDDNDISSSRAVKIAMTDELARPVNSRQPARPRASQSARSIKWAPDNQLVVEVRAKTQYSYNERAVRWRRRKEILLACLRRERYEDE